MIVLFIGFVGLAKLKKPFELLGLDVHDLGHTFSPVIENGKLCLIDASIRHEAALKIYDVSCVTLSGLIANQRLSFGSVRVVDLD